ncbi:MAG: alpha-amylase domain-containing protein [Bacteroidota bacterium]
MRWSVFVGLVVLGVQSFSQNTEIPVNTPKSDVFLQGFYWNSTPGGLWWDSIASLAPRIGAAGFGAVWLPSPVKGAGGGFSMGYDPYDHYDFGEYNQKGTVETRFGSRQELINAIDALHAVGVQSFADAVMGHMNGAEQYVPVDCEPYPSYPDSAWLVFNYPNGSGRFKKNAASFYPNQLTCNVDPPYHGPSDPIFKFGEVPAHTQFHVRDSLITWGHYLKDVMGFDGFRLDAVKHINPEFVGQWLNAVGGYAVAEYYGSTSEIGTWLNDCQNVFGGDVSMFDFPLRFTLKDMCNNTSGTFDMNWLDGAGLINAGISGYDVATFVENHDLDRTGWDGSLDNGHAPIIYDKDLGYAYTIFSEGRPSVFFRDYFIYGLANTIDKLIWIREKFLHGSTTKRDGLSPWYVGSLGTQEEQSRDIYVARRNGGDGRPQSFLVINDNPSEWRGVWVNSNHPDAVFRDYTGVAMDKQAAGDGRVELWAPPRGFALYVPDTTQHLNHHPYINFVSDLSAFANTPFSHQITAGDLNGDTLSYALTGNPLWLSVTSSGLLTGTPSSGDTTTSQVVVNVSDPWGGSTTDTFLVSVRSRPVMDGVFEGLGVWGSAVRVADTLAGWDGARAREVYVTQDDNYFYFGANIRARQSMNWAFLINTKPGGGASESWSRSINYIHGNKPDYILRGHFQGYAELHTWNGFGWNGVGTPLAGSEFGENITLDSLNDGWVEGRVLKSALGNPPVLAVQFYLTGNQNVNATFDACPNDQNTTAWSGVTTSLRYYTLVGQKQITESNLQFPATTIIAGGGSATVYARTFALGVTDSTGQGGGIVAWVGTSPTNSHPSTWMNWYPATFNVDVAAYDEYQSSIGSDLTGGTYYYASRFQYTGGPYLFGGYSSGGGGFWNGTSNVSGILTVQAPPGVPILASPPNAAVNISPNLTLVWQALAGSPTYHVQLATDSLLTSLVLNDSTIAGNSRSVTGLAYSTRYFWRVKAKNTFGSSAFSAVWSFTIFTPQTMDLSVTPSWNLLSVPLTVLDGRRGVLFPSATSEAYAFNSIGGYVLKDTMTPGAGYWLKFAAADTVDVTGGFRANDTIHVQSGWNLIGSISSTVPVNSIIQFPDSIVGSMYFGYNSGYAPSDSISPGEAYWVKANFQGKLFLSSGVFFRNAQVPSTISSLEKMSSVTIRDAAGFQQTLYFGESTGNRDEAVMYEMPPTPPQGIFDARFASQRMSEVIERESSVKEFDIRLSSAVYPLKITWSITGSFSHASIVTNDQVIVMESGGSADVYRSNSTLRLRVQSSHSVPTEFTLDQNYPNPFNPSTTVRFGLPHQAIVSLKVFDVLGREVRSLLQNEARSAGWHNVNFDAAGLASGVYFYRLSASDIVNSGISFQKVGRMLLLK